MVSPVSEIEIVTGSGLLLNFFKLANKSFVRLADEGSWEELDCVAMVLGCSSAPATLSSLEQALNAPIIPNVPKEIEISFLKFLESSLYFFCQREKLQV